MFMFILDGLVSVLMIIFVWQEKDRNMVFEECLSVGTVVDLWPNVNRMTKKWKGKKNGKLLFKFWRSLDDAQNHFRELTNLKRGKKSTTNESIDILNDFAFHFISNFSFHSINSIRQSNSFFMGFIFYNENEKKIFSFPTNWNAGAYVVNHNINHFTRMIIIEIEFVWILTNVRFVHFSTVCILMT